MIPQLIANALIAAATYALVGLGFAMIHWSGKFLHFTHAASFTLGAYIAFSLTTFVHFPLPFAVSFAVLGSAAFGGFVQFCVYAPLRRRGTSSFGLLLASLGLMVATQNAISLVYGDDVKSMRNGIVSRGVNIIGSSVTGIQIVTVALAITVSLALWLAFHHTRFGRAFRAVCDDPELATIVGVNSDRVVLLTFILGSAIAGVAAVVIALDTDMSPNMGLRVLLMSVTAVIVGGEGRIHGVAFGALLVGLTQHLGVLWLDTQWQDATVFMLLIMFLLVRPQGFFGRPQRKAAV